MTPRERQRAKRARRKAQGRCVDCEEPTAEQACDYHAAIRKHAVIRYIRRLAEARPR